MTTDEFCESVLPRIMAAWEKKCFCANPTFRKLIGFNFEDYGIGPACLADSEILIDAIIYQKFAKQGEMRKEQWANIQSFVCPQCQRICTVTWEDFSINMDRAYVTYDGEAATTSDVLFLTWFRGFGMNFFSRIKDFRIAPSTDDFLNQFISG